MPSPPVTLYMTTIASQPALRQRQEYILRILQVKKIPFTTYDLASDEEAKRLWRRKAPADKQQLPGILVGGKYPGTFAEFEDAVEHDELEVFLRLKEKWDPLIDEDRPPPLVKPVGIPGAASPLQMTPDRLKSVMYPSTSSPSPLKGKIVPINKRTNELDLGDELSGYGLQGVKVTQDELADLVAELGLDGADAGDLVKGLTDLTSSKSSAKMNVEDKKVEEKPEEPKEKLIEELKVKLKEESKVEPKEGLRESVAVKTETVEEKVEESEARNDEDSAIRSEVTIKVEENADESKTKEDISKIVESGEHKKPTPVVTDA